MENLSHHSKLNSSGLTTDTDISPGEIIIGTILGINSNGQALVDFPGNIRDEPIPAISTISVSHQLSGQQVALLFNEGKINHPVIMGVIHNPLTEILENFELSAEVSDSEQAITGNSQNSTSMIPDNIAIDGKRILLEGSEEIVLKCGEASITLTKSGKILIRGKYLLNRSTGVNRILGGSVQVN